MNKAIRIIGIWITANIILLLVFALFINLLDVSTISWEAIPTTVYLLTLVITSIFTLIIGAQLDDDMWKDNKY